MPAGYLEKGQIIRDFLFTVHVDTEIFFMFMTQKTRFYNYHVFAGTFHRPFIFSLN